MPTAGAELLPPSLRRTATPPPFVRPVPRAITFSPSLLQQPRHAVLEPRGQCGSAENTKTPHVWSGVVDGALLVLCDRSPTSGRILYELGACCHEKTPPRRAATGHARKAQRCRSVRPQPYLAQRPTPYAYQNRTQLLPPKTPNGRRRHIPVVSTMYYRLSPQKACACARGRYRPAKTDKADYLLQPHRARRATRFFVCSCCLVFYCRF